MRNNPRAADIQAADRNLPAAGDPQIRVTRGASLLTRERPGWRDEVSIRELRVALGYPGVLGQLWPDSSGDPTATGLAALGITAGEGWFGFRPLPGEPWETLDAAWIAEVAQ